MTNFDFKNNLTTLGIVAKNIDHGVFCNIYVHKNSLIIKIPFDNNYAIGKYNNIMSYTRALTKHGH